MRTTVDVARDLTAIEQLAGALEDEAVHRAAHPLMPGGLAMVALGPVASSATYDAQLDELEELAIAYAYAHGLDSSDLMPETYEDVNWEPPLQTLLFWSEDWRNQHDRPLVDEHGHARRPTVATEASFIRWALDWAWDNELHWNDFADDVRAVRSRLESVLYDGVRVVARGAPCLYEECRGARLVRKTVPTRGPNGRKAWRLTDWHCPRCKRSWSEEAYAGNVYAAIERSHWEDMAGLDGEPEAWCTVDRAARKVDRPEGTIRSWVSRGEVLAACSIRTRRTLVRLADVEARDQLARDRRARWIATQAASGCASV